MVAAAHSAVCALSSLSHTLAPFVWLSAVVQVQGGAIKHWGELLRGPLLLQVLAGLVSCQSAVGCALQI
jgi:hypothetical protein